MAQEINPSNCLSNVIALDSICDGVSPTSGIYGTDDGLTRNYLSEILTEDFENEEALFNSKLNLGIKTIENQIHSFYQPRYKTVSVVDSFRAGQYEENKIEVGPYAGHKGILFDLNSEISHLDQFISEASLFVNYSGAITLKVYDLLQGRLLTSFSITTVAGQITSIYPLKKFLSAKRRLTLFICYDATLVESYKTVLRSSGCSTCSDHYLDNSYERIGMYKIPTGSSFTRENLIPSSDTGGLSIVQSLQCNHTEWMCGISNLLAYPILYKTSALIHEHALFSAVNSRFNTSTSDRELIQKRLDAAEFKYREWMDSNIKGLLRATDSFCFQCNSTYSHSISLP